MARRSSIEQLPEALQKACHEAIGRGATIDAITDMLNGMGGDVSRSAVGRYAQDYRELVAKQRDMTAMAQAFGREFSDTDDRTGAMMTQLMQTLMTSTLLPLITGKDGENGEELDALTVSRLAKAVKDVAGAAKVDVEREKAIREETRKQAREEAASAADSAARRAGADPATIELIKKEIMGL